MVSQRSINSIRENFSSYSHPGQGMEIQGPGWMERFTSLSCFGLPKKALGQVTHLKQTSHLLLLNEFFASKLFPVNTSLVLAVCPQSCPCVILDPCTVTEAVKLWSALFSFVPNRLWICRPEQSQVSLCSQAMDRAAGVTGGQGSGSSGASLTLPRPVSDTFSGHFQHYQRT